MAYFQPEVFLLCNWFFLLLYKPKFDYSMWFRWQIEAVWHIFACLVFLFPAFLLFFSSLIERLTLAVTIGIITVVLILYYFFFAEGVGEELEWDLSKCHCSVSLKVICYSRSLSRGQIEIQRATILSVVTYNLN